MATVPDPTTPLETTGATMDGTTDSSKVTCRGEPLCLTQVCNPDAYKVDLATAGSAFPYSVSYTTTNSLTDTTFVFMVCSTKSKSCGPNSRKPACAALQSFQLRIRDDLLENGRSILAEPVGTNWASCKPQGPGYLWDSPKLSNLSLPTSADTCQTLSVTVASDEETPATLADICQQDVSIVDNKGASIFESSTLPPFCFFSMSNTAGVTAFGNVVDPLASNKDALPTAYGASAMNKRRSLRASQASTNPGRLF